MRSASRKYNMVKQQGGWHRIAWAFLKVRTGFTSSRTRRTRAARILNDCSGHCRTRNASEVSFRLLVLQASPMSTRKFGCNCISLLCDSVPNLSSKKYLSFCPLLLSTQVLVLKSPFFAFCFSPSFGLEMQKRVTFCYRFFSGGRVLHGCRMHPLCTSQ